jgi:hypothetical protein
MKLILEFEVKKISAFRGYNAGNTSESQPMLWRNMSPPSSRFKYNPSKK